MSKRKTGFDREPTGAILIADDEATTRKLLEHHLQRAGFATVLASDGQQALERVDGDVAAVLLDLHMPKVSGLDCLKQIVGRHPELPVIVISQSNAVADAVAAMQKGARDYICKPIDPDELLARLRQQLQHRQLRDENRQLRQAVSTPPPAELYLGKSAAAEQLAQRVRKIAAIDSTVLITGESGTGKTTLARLIHQQSPRAAHEFIHVSCGTVPTNMMEATLFGHVRGAFTDAFADRPGSVEVADGGTLFLDEIGDLPLEMQPKLLTFLQDSVFARIGDPRPRHVDVRVMAATHRDLEQMVADREFRQDLYYRLNVVPLVVPPLRDRPEDIPGFARFILARIARRRNGRELRLADDAAAEIRRRPWSANNVRELENALERAAAFCENDCIAAADLDLRLPAAPAHLPPSGSLAGLTLDDVERRAIIDTLKETGGNKKAAARMLGIDEKSIYNKMRRLGITFP